MLCYYFYGSIYCFFFGVVGYCGQPIVAQFQVPKDIGIALATYRVLAVAEIHSTAVVGLSSCTQLVSRNVVSDNIRSNNNVNKNPLFGGEIDFVRQQGADNYVVQVSFNKEADSWNYGWLSNRWNTELHVVEIILFGHMSDFYSTVLSISTYNANAAIAIAASIAEGCNTSDSVDDDSASNYVVLGSFKSTEFAICCTKDGGEEKMKHEVGHSISSSNKVMKKNQALETRIKRQRELDELEEARAQRRMRVEVPRSNVESNTASMSSSSRTTGQLPTHTRNTRRNSREAVSAAAVDSTAVVSSADENAAGLSAEQKQQLMYLQELQYKILANGQSLTTDDWDRLSKTNSSSSSGTTASTDNVDALPFNAPMSSSNRPNKANKNSNESDSLLALLALSTMPVTQTPGSASVTAPDIPTATDAIHVPPPAATDTIVVNPSKYAFNHSKQSSAHQGVAYTDNSVSINLIHHHHNTPSPAALLPQGVSIGVPLAVNVDSHLPEISPLCIPSSIAAQSLSQSEDALIKEIQVLTSNNINNGNALVQSSPVATISTSTAAHTGNVEQQHDAEDLEVGMINTA